MEKKLKVVNTITIFKVLLHGVATRSDITPCTKIEKNTRFT